MPHTNPKGINFECEECGEEFNDAENYTKISKNGEFVEYKSTCPECGNRCSNDSEENDIVMGAKKSRSPKMSERDFSHKVPMPNLDKAKESINRHYGDAESNDSEIDVEGSQIAQRIQRNSED